MKATGTVMAIGGAEDKIKGRALLTEFVRLAGAEDARIVIIPSASTIPKERGELYTGIFSEIGAGSVQILQLATRQQANSSRSARIVADATAVFVTGGIQLRLISLLGGTAIAAAIHELIASGGVYCGTSAGAAAISSHMIVTGREGMKIRRGMVDLAPGLGLISHAIVDQHFSQRGRLGRLIAAIGMNPQFLGIGIDEDTAAVFHADATMEVHGTGQVVVVDASGVTSTDVHSVSKTRPFMMSPLQLHLLNEGSRFEFTRRRIVAPRKSVVVQRKARA
ncbi:MAG TPA: cyanophycinase [Thermoanaerobaculia bacterium]|nr:cyanophycinase [Thermoanaerobaculia bacterium]